MNTLKEKCKVAMLPTDKEATKTILLNPSSGKIELSKNYFASEYHKAGYETYYLYILSDEEIQKNDWVLDNRNTCNNFIHQISCNVKGDVKKIIASTNPMNNELSIDGNIGNMPQPSKAFIEKYIELYNKGNVITEVLVEYEEKLTNKEENIAISWWDNGLFPRERIEYKVRGGYDINAEYRSGSISTNDICKWYYQDLLPKKIKINTKDNTITIHPVKNSWNREEVIELTKSAFITGSRINDITYYKWMEQNL